jgi:predicted MFS family arabinose efflux permease
MIPSSIQICPLFQVITASWKPRALVMMVLRCGLVCDKLLSTLSSEIASFTVSRTIAGVDLNWVSEEKKEETELVAGE